MRAKVINYPSGPVVAFGGIEYVKYEWRDVPLGFEAQAEQHPFLEIEVVEPEPEPPKPKPKPATKAAAKPKPKPRKRTRRKVAPKVSKDE